MKITNEDKLWRDVILWILFTYALLPLSAVLYDLFLEHTPFFLITKCLAGLFAFVCLVLIIRKLTPTRLILFGVTFFFYFRLLKGVLSAEGTVHVLEHMITGFVISRAAIRNKTTLTSLLTAFFFISFFSWADEQAQNFVPNRGYEFKDVILNIVSAAFGLAFWITAGKKDPSDRMKEKPHPSLP